MKRIEQGPKTGDLSGPERSNRDAPFDVPGREFQYVGSGKAAIAAVLSYLRETHVFRNKMDELIVPAWIGVAVYQQITEFCFPSLHPTDKTRAVLVYHQYGFPQNMNRVLDYASSRKVVVIEDCAHSVSSDFQGQRLGAIGEFAIYSFSKFCFCFALGGISYSDSDFQGYLHRLKQKSSRSLGSLINIFKLLDETNLSRTPPVFPLFFKGLRRMAYSRYGESLRAEAKAIHLWAGKKDREILLRKENYRYLRDNLDRYGVCDHLEADGVTPYVVPLLLPEDQAERLVRALRERHFETGLYHFDVNRCVLEPKYEKTVLIPIHSGIRREDLDLVVGLVKRTL